MKDARLRFGARLCGAEHRLPLTTGAVSKPLAHLRVVLSEPCTTQSKSRLGLLHTHPCVVGCELGAEIIYAIDHRVDFTLHFFLCGIQSFNHFSKADISHYQ